MCLTATCTEAIFNAVTSTLKLPDISVVSALPDRPDIFLHFKHSTGMKYEEELEWLVKHVAENGENSKKVIVYCQTINQVSNVFEHCVSTLGGRAWKEGAERTINSRLFGMYHGSVGSAMETEMLKRFTCPSSTVRVMICTIAFGMGVEVKDVDIIIHWGASKTILDYWQQVGRCARDGRPGEAFLYAYAKSLDRRKVNEDMIQFCKSMSMEKSCVRHAILSHFTLPRMDTRKLDLMTARGQCNLKCNECRCEHCTCCQHCRQRCNCTKPQTTKEVYS